MFKKKPKEQPIEEEKVEEPKEPEPIRKSVPDPETAWIVVRDYIGDWIMCLSNLTKQQKTDINVCMEYLHNYIKGHREIDDVAKQLDDRVIDDYSKTLKKNGYTVTINIKKNTK